MESNNTNKGTVKFRTIRLPHVTEPYEIGSESLGTGRKGNLSHIFRIG